MDYMADNKLRAMVDLLDQIKNGPYPTKLVYRVLTKLDKNGIVYLLDELPEGKSYSYYCDELDKYIVKVLKGETK